MKTSEAQFEPYESKGTRERSEWEFTVLLGAPSFVKNLGNKSSVFASANLAISNFFYSVVFVGQGFAIGLKQIYEILMGHFLSKKIYFLG